ncbi:MAG: Rrf2 family transcriptional regulator [Gracilibacteraceae bacterium]|nr:Rrf2 family transcriptional regulator [Gracilibacteraceae bacterium]
MKFTTRGRYSVQIMVDLSRRISEGPVSLKSIADRHNLSESYLEQLICELRKADLVRSVRGAQGGYVLKRDPGQITVGEIIRSVAGSIAPVDCEYQTETLSCSCDPDEQCLTRDLWVRLRDSVNELVDSIFLSDLVKKPGDRLDVN